MVIETIGRLDAAYSSGGNYELLGGFCPGGPLCLVDFDHFAKFAEQWWLTGTGLPADLYEDLICSCLLITGFAIILKADL
jgi:hypothetical protein